MLGSADPDRPALGIFGGIHGLELIGAEVALEFLRHLVMRLAWDEDLHHLLGRLRLVFMPLVQSGRDLARHARKPERRRPDAQLAGREAREPAFLLGGQRISRFLPWYRGRLGAAMENALCAIVEASCWAARSAWRSTATPASGSLTGSGSVCAHRGADCPSGRDPCAEVAVRAGPRPSRLPVPSPRAASI